MSAEYGADQIQILEGLEAVRKRPGMYIGSTSSRGLHHLVYEIVDNSVDEALAGYCTEINVIINADNSITVIDNGRGIPVGIQKKAGLPAVEVVFTVLHAGGKFGGGGYKVSGGLHGVGASVVNALSEWLEVNIYQDGKEYNQRYERGKVMYPLRVVGDCPADKHGTRVTFLPDKEIFEETIYDFETLRVRLQETAFLTKALRITLKDDREEKQEKVRIMEENLLAASLVPLHMMEKAVETLTFLEVLGEKGSRMAVSDVGVAVQFARTALTGAVMNVYINTKSMKNREKAEELNTKARELIKNGTKKADEIYEKVLEQLT